MIRAWLGAVLLCFAGILVIVNLPSGDLTITDSERFDYAARQLDPVPDFLVLGSSLSRMAFPAHIRLDAGPADDTPALTGLRIALSCVRPMELARLLEEATARGVSTILVEINHLLYDLKSCQPETDVGAMLANFGLVLRWRVKGAIFGTDNSLTEAADEPALLRQIYDGDESKLRLHYRATLRSPEVFDVLEPGLAAGRQKGLSVIFVVMPRSETASRFLGAAFNAGMDARLAGIRGRFANRVWEPARSWPNRYFADRAHMNEAGRKRITFEMQQVIGDSR